MCKNCTAAFHVVSLLTLDTSHAVHLILSSSLICDLKCSDTEYKPLDCDIQVKGIEWDSFATISHPIFHAVPWLLCTECADILCAFWIGFHWNDFLATM